MELVYEDVLIGISLHTGVLFPIIKYTINLSNTEHLLVAFEGERERERGKEGGRERE